MSSNGDDPSVGENESPAYLRRLQVEQLRWVKFNALSSGFVCLVDVMGDDAAVVQAARVSYGEGTKHVQDDQGLINYLMRHRHTTPFEMVELKFLVRCPMDLWRQWIRHRTANVNEYSTRYSHAIDEMDQTPPGEWRLQSTTNKQGSGAMVTDWPAGYCILPVGPDGKRLTADNKRVSVEAAIAANHVGWAIYHGAEPESDELYPESLAPKQLLVLETMHFDSIQPGYFLSHLEALAHRDAKSLYDLRLEFGVAREQARKDLPLSNYTQAYWKIDLHNLLHFLSLRMDGHAQKEIRDYATIIGEQIVKPLFPMVWTAFERYRLNAMMLSQPCIEVIHGLLAYMDCCDVAAPVAYDRVLSVMGGINPDWIQQDSEGRLKPNRERNEIISTLSRLKLAYEI